MAMTNHTQTEDDDWTTTLGSVIDEEDQPEEASDEWVTTDGSEVSFGIDQYEGASDDRETIREDEGDRVPVDTHTIPPTHFNSHLDAVEMRSLQIPELVLSWIAHLPQRGQAIECANEKEAVVPPIHHVAERPHCGRQYRGFGPESFSKRWASLSIEERKEQEIMELMWFRVCVRQQFRTAFNVNGRLRTAHWDLLFTKNEDGTLMFPLVLRTPLRIYNTALELREGLTDIDTPCSTLQKRKRSSSADEPEDGSGHFEREGGAKRAQLWTETIPNGAKAPSSIKKKTVNALVNLILKLQQNEGLLGTQVKKMDVTMENKSERK
ncbi:hypothetical protein N7520_004124 [Penicillium odoratum]|uniref:uncharacterized protein n=1 Tax=Penicillium odoratum TaxID=1167516 RepID=UPI002549B298|nr:uncharacterized protein N7520_004124 [Penicillium odoratum]KAJ5769565.1 hypothetical protein N7520_004124 [Penicillium odoratum]